MAASELPAIAVTPMNATVQTTPALVKPLHAYLFGWSGEFVKLGGMSAERPSTLNNLFIVDWRGTPALRRVPAEFFEAGRAKCALASR